MAEHKIYSMPFADVYPHYVAKAERKGKTKEDVDRIIEWLTGYDKESLAAALDDKIDFRKFYEEAPNYNPRSSEIKGVVCGIRVEEIEDPLMQKIRHLDKLIDELARGKKMENILR